MQKSCWLIGAGYMAAEYIKVLKTSAVDLHVIGRGEERAKLLAAEFNIKVTAGGITNQLKITDQLPNFAIVAVSVEELSSVLIQLIEIGVKNILIEKPGALTQTELNQLVELSKQHNVEVSIAYNRRFYAAINYLKEQVAADGGITSVNFEFTEWIHTIDVNKFPKPVLEKFLIANSTHVIDAVFHLIGRPKILNAQVSGNEVSWHPAGSIFVGSGISENDVLFSYSSNWGAPGRWAIEVLTNKRKYYLKPLERLAIQQKGSVLVEELAADYTIDVDFKPGLKGMVDAFFSKDKKVLCSIFEHQKNFYFYDKIAGYKK
ncbi:Gfo/Idh/MocA family protein [Pedobacter fastidiosus]|uniref:Gfo/Idh/MocA family oxidoreductase n=1 Tax=Pedobacter fastidiosus TaxID=2765361 RepID=A0ABR7KR61_9SPHI|nr:Gfo/Idh/MocA family oxidoreductase [Pedobacter fastidiosus]MBC6110552.1 Gfo/Idh/MocA family oxidoreductase [Pedobacter fastidiosus]